MDCNCLFFFSRPLHCLFFFDLRILIIPLVYSNFSNHCEKGVCCCKYTFWYIWNHLSTNIFFWSSEGSERSCIRICCIDFVPVSTMSPLYMFDLFLRCGIVSFSCQRWKPLLFFSQDVPTIIFEKDFTVTQIDHSSYIFGVIW